MKRIMLPVMLLLMAMSAPLSAAQMVVTANPVPGAEQFIDELISRGKLAKDYFMTSTDEAAGKTFDERMGNLAKRIRVSLQEFAAKRTQHYKETRIQFSGSDWATRKHTPKLEEIAADTYIFTAIERTRNGDWKGGPTIAGVDRAGWTGGDIPGGSVWWVTGGHGHAETYWKIDARYADSYIARVVNEEVGRARKRLNVLNIPADL